MKKLLLFIFLFMFFCSGTAFCVEIKGVTLPDSFKAGDSDLMLNGYGLRTKFGFKVYAIGMYLKTKNSDAKKIMDADEPMTLVMRFRRTIPVSKMSSVFYDSFAEAVKAPEQDDYNEKSDYGPLTKEIVDFMNVLAARKVTKKDTFTFVYIPGKGTEVFVNDGNGDISQTVIPGLEFKKVLLSIWIGEDPPVGNGLKNEMLGIASDSFF